MSLHLLNGGRPQPQAGSLIIKADGTTYRRHTQSYERRRQLEKRPRPPARHGHWVPPAGVRLTEANLTPYEAELGVAAVAWDDGYLVGRILGYDPGVNVFTVVATRANRKGKSFDLQVLGARVSGAIIAARMIAGVARLDRDELG